MTDNSFTFTSNGNYYPVNNPRVQSYPTLSQRRCNLNTPQFPMSVFASTEYDTEYCTHPKQFKGFSPDNRLGYYMDVYGRPAKTNVNFPYILQVFSPRPHENRFQTKESALNEAPKIGDWQIVNIFTGEEVYGPRRINTHSFNCNCGQVHNRL